MAEITGVVKNSAADRARIMAGDELISVNGHKISDVLDYMYYTAEDTVKLVLKRDKKFIMLKIKKNEYDDLGLNFASFLMDEKQSCRNKCIFCFIDQTPPHMRETLYFKDDDARLSFLQGNYVTLTNLEDSDIKRIIDMRLNINVSVHTTNPELRCKMMNNRFAGEKLKYLKMLAEGGISMNCQLVLCPDINDGEEYRRTINDLSALMPNISSIAAVPVGLTKYREGLYPLRLFTKDECAALIDMTEEMQKDFLKRFGTRLVFLSDEFYINAGRDIPPAEYYEGYPQYENGVGMIRSLNDEFREALAEIADKKFPDSRCTVATGMLDFKFMNGLAEKVSETFGNISCKVIPIKNDFYGETITVTGLLTGRDLISQLKGKLHGDRLLLSSNMFMRDSDVFLDDCTVSDVEEALNTKVVIVGNNGKELLTKMLGMRNEELGMRNYEFRN